MQFAIVEDQRREAFPGGHGSCPTCGAAAIAKCGPRVMHHWAHASRRDCDPWWENETPWHREWKKLFPADCREISHVAPDGEIHRADIKTPTGIVVEVQHSAITDAERVSREAFYGNLVWIIDGRGFRRNFDICHALPDPASEVARDLVWVKATRDSEGAFFRLSQCLTYNPKATKADLGDGLHEIHPIRRVESQLNATYSGHHQYDWVRPRRTWLDATCPVYIDFGEDWLAQLMAYDESGLRCMRYVAKRKFVHDAMVETDARAIATRFYPIG
ncbi:CoiA-like domain protein [Trinickia sp. NRRL B-1857]|uniref:competence protein CoiA n=1 Tax=Trinickia sp. NRRL B-1857 TaxID=3162879 RepID=UPI003D29119C